MIKGVARIKRRVKSLAVSCAEKGIQNQRSNGRQKDWAASPRNGVRIMRKCFCFARALSASAPFLSHYTLCFASLILYFALDLPCPDGSPNHACLSAIYVEPSLCECIIGHLINTIRGCSCFPLFAFLSYIHLNIQFTDTIVFRRICSEPLHAVIITNLPTKDIVPSYSALRYLSDCQITFFPVPEIIADTEKVTLPPVDE